ncbi:Peptidoglycan/LPS O-acetylase OafA/YrhL, contains acyltransferase and SGNH-hydrolase domains [Granulicella rosea]|uniref:Peptidoglycan/LPS O-acetylase OafA/YrhL, contains acyltransferase and SGNH-hydrolase domains n=2 Tax=Granulicella rosea TaxID=474952 RepID=A0A239DP83_9BACT|nr:Peptidoglycan/LPS O-acetylase OafA/YrhL, contains acyltransferase and SGNH-hydrolase domains [Granulicella rosea]
MLGRPTLCKGAKDGAPRHCERVLNPMTEQPNQTRSWTRIDGVDCLRALAIFYVLMNHVNMRLRGARIPYTHGMPKQLVVALVWQGQPGVQIFFAVSGFLIAATTIRRWGTLGDVRIKDFYLIRFARIAPLLLTLLAILSLLHALHVPNYVVKPQTGGLGRALVAALTFHIGWLEATRGYLPGNWDILWSLSVEELFYLGFPLACRFLRGRWLIALLGVFVVLGPFGRTLLTHGNDVWQEYSYLGGMDAIALGCLTAICLAHRTLKPATVRACLAGGLTLLILCLTCSPQLAKLKLEETGLLMTFVGIGACLVIAAASQSRWRAPRFVRPLLAYGRNSYEVYLTHMFVVYTCFDQFVRWGKPLTLVWPLFGVTILLAGALGVLVARFYSEPANRWLRVRFGDGPREIGTVLREG